MQLVGLTSKLKAVDCARLSCDRGVTRYLFKGLFKPGEEALEEALNEFLDALVLSMGKVCDLDRQPPTAAMKEKFSKHAVDMALKLARFEKDAPGTFSDVLFLLLWCAFTVALHNTQVQETHAYWKQCQTYNRVKGS